MGNQFIHLSSHLDEPITLEWGQSGLIRPHDLYPLKHSPVFMLCIKLTVVKKKILLQLKHINHCSKYAMEGPQIVAFFVQVMYKQFCGKPGI